MKQLPIANLLDKETHGTAIPVLGNPEFSTCGPSAQLLGTVNDNRGRWNPFLPENDMSQEGGRYVKEVTLRRNGGRHRDGIYAFRFTAGHSLLNTFKADHSRTDSGGKPTLSTVHQAHNVMMEIHKDGVYRISFDPSSLAFDVFPRPAYLTAIQSVQLNGFVWDDEDLFQKFDESRHNHDMTKNGEWWEITLPLRRDGGINFRRDGVYQFLFSANHNEDWGFGAYNDGSGRLTGGTGFGSSGGQSKHSAITLRVFENSQYTLTMNPQTFEFHVDTPHGIKPPQILNDITSFQLLGTMYSDAQFDPTNKERHMDNAGPLIWEKTLELSPGVYAANFAISQELFLDTMALGAWLVPQEPNKLVGRAWHGKPNEPNIFFQIFQKGSYKFGYDSKTDEFTIAALQPEGETWDIPALQSLPVLDTLQLVGGFDPPLQSWDPTSASNNMERFGDSTFRRDVRLEGGRTYEYKYTANNWGWLWVLSDYELDGYGKDFLGRNPDPERSRLEDLRVYGHLTTHGDPPTLRFTPPATGYYTFTANLETGAYAVQPTQALNDTREEHR